MLVILSVSEESADVVRLYKQNILIRHAYGVQILRAYSQSEYDRNFSFLRLQDDS